MIESLRLSLDSDPVALRDDLARIPADRWIAHFNTRNYEGDWSGVANNGSEHRVYLVVDCVIDEWLIELFQSSCD